MSDRLVDISTAATAVRAELQAAGITVPTAENYLQYRRNLRAGSAADIAEAIARFDGEVEDIVCAGVGCRQLTPSSWSETDGLCIQYAYGGGYVSGSTDEDQMITLPLARETDARVIMVDYRLSPEDPFPAAQQDMQQVYAALMQDYGAQRLVIAGESAGGNQALQVLQYARDQGLDLACCAVLLSPWVDLANQGDSHTVNDQRDPSLNNAWVDSAASLHANGHPLDDPAISPIHADMRDLPPTLITSGSHDLLLSQCLRLAQKLHQAGVICDLRVWEGLWHVFEFYPIPEAEQSITEMAEFIRVQSS